MRVRKKPSGNWEVTIDGPPDPVAKKRRQVSRSRWPDGTPCRNQADARSLGEAILRELEQKYGPRKSRAGRPTEGGERAAPAPLVSRELNGLLKEVVRALGVHVVEILVPAIVGRLEDQSQKLPPPLPEIMNMEQCARFLGRSRHTVREFTRRQANPIPHHRLGGQTAEALYIKSEVLEWVRSQ